MNASSVVLCLALVSAACGSDAAFAPSSVSETLYWRLRLDRHAVQLSMTPPYDTTQLTAALETPSGAPWAAPAGVESGATVWVSLDSSKVLVSDDGRITARATTDGDVRVVVRRQIENVTHADTVQVRVVNDPHPPTLTTFRIRPEPPDSSKVETFSSRGFDVVTLDGNGRFMDLVTYFSASDTTVAKFDDPWQPWITSRRVGETLVMATTWAYGTARTDTFTLTVSYSMIGITGVQMRFFSGELRQLGKNVTIGVGGEVVWNNWTGGYDEENDEVREGQPFDVIFEHPEYALASADPDNDSGAGDIMGVPPDPFDDTQSRRFRRFTEPGVYRYSIPQFGFTGTIIVRSP